MAVACDRGQGTTPPATPGAAYVTKAETVFFDGGCAQDKASGKLKKGTRFTLVASTSECWNIRLEDEDDVYIVPEKIAPAP